MELRVPAIRAQMARWAQSLPSRIQHGYRQEVPVPRDQGDSYTPVPSVTGAGPVHVAHTKVSAWSVRYFIVLIVDAIG